MKTRRNDPCPCGSGQKFKQCCGRGATVAVPPTPSLRPRALKSSAAPGVTPALPEMHELARLIDAARFAEVESQAQTMTQLHPQYGAAWKALGIALTVQHKPAAEAWIQAAKLLPGDVQTQINAGDAWWGLRRYEDAVASYRRALDLDPSVAAGHNNLGNALRALERTAEAVESYRQAITINAQFSEAHNNLGNALRALGQIDEAVTSYRRSLEIRPDSAEVHNNLGNALLDLGEPGGAAASYQRALELRPGFVEAHGNLGNALRKQGRLEHALLSYQRAIELAPSFAAAHSNMSDALRDLGRLDDAIASSRRAIDLDPAMAGGYNSLGNALQDTGRLEEAAASYRQALSLKPNFIEALINLGLVMRLQGNAKDAEATCRRALDIEPRAAAAFVLLAELRADSGAFSDAEELFNRALALDPASSEACAGIVHLRKMTLGDAAWVSRAESIVQGGLAPSHEVYLRYAMGKYHDDVRNFEQAFEQFRLANELTRRVGTSFDREALTRAADQVLQSRLSGAVQSAARIADTRPIFIVGMPRSGTSLAEQILASHAAIVGAGELPFWSALGNRSVGNDADEQTVQRITAEYLRLIDGLAPSALRVVDKMPANFWTLGLIHAALPGARIIHMRRNPVDTCLSIYFQHFNSGHRYANDLADLAHYYTQYSRVMAHWHALLPAGVILDVPYEALVDDQETWSREMLRFVDVPWDPHCLEYHQTTRSVRTASKWQVRQKIHRASVERWRNYERFIAPLLKLLPP